jgi:hypothetical protein
VPKAFDDLVEDQVLGYQLKEAAGRMAVAQQQVREQALCVYTRVLIHLHTCAHTLAHVCMCSYTCTPLVITLAKNTPRAHTTPTLSLLS